LRPAEEKTSPLVLVLAPFGVFLLASFLSMIAVGILGSSNIVWGEQNQYGRVRIPDTKVLSLPAEKIVASVAVLLPGRGNETPDLPLPDDLSLDVRPVAGARKVVVTPDVGATGNAIDRLDNTLRRAWRIEVPAAGKYRVRARGSFLGIGVNPELWLGRERPIPGERVPLVGALLGLLITIGWGVSQVLARRRRAATAGSP
jgi:hypothetical protein